MFSEVELIVVVTAALPCILAVVVIWVFKPIVFLMKDEQLFLETTTSREVRNGPGTVLFLPILSKATKRLALLLDEREYVVVTDNLTGTQRVEVGPKLFFQGAYEAVSKKELKIVLEQDEYIKVLDSKSGIIHVVPGPAVFVPKPTESVPGGKQKAASLKRHEYVRLVDAATGEMRIERGEQLVVPKAMETMETKKSAFKLRKNEYIKLFDTTSGVVRVEYGEQIVFPTPTEDPQAVVAKAVDVDYETAVLVVSKETGQQRLVTKKGPFFPGPYDEILEVRKLIRVEPHETAIVIDQDGTYTFFDGSSDSSQKGTAFFLQPFCSLITMQWSEMKPQEHSGDGGVVRKQRRVAAKFPVTKIDLRAQYTFFDYNVRTSDNVELVLEGTIFWQVVDVQQMIRSTGDPQGDVWFHCRSALISEVSRVSLETFMTEFNRIVNEAAHTDAEFYKSRGVCVHSLEVTRYECADKKTSGVLQEIIQETTNRINRMQHQQSENEVGREKLLGEIEMEKQRTALIQAKADNDRMEASTEGESQGLRLAKSAETFMGMLKEPIPDSDERLGLLKFFGEQQTSTQQAQHLASGSANLFLTPQDMNLKLKLQSNGAAEFSKV